MSDVMAKLSDDHPMMVAWEKFRSTDGYANTLRWARHIAVTERERNNLIEIQHPHTEGSLWAAFMAGWNARGDIPTGEKP